METTKELLKLDALIGKNPFDKTLPKVCACNGIYSFVHKNHVPSNVF